MRNQARQCFFGYGLVLLHMGDFEITLQLVSKRVPARSRLVPNKRLDTTGYQVMAEKNNYGLTMMLGGISCSLAPPAEPKPQ